MGKPSRADDRMMWLLRWMTHPVWCRHGFVVAWDTELVDAFVGEFPESRKTMKVYTLGPNSVPMLNRAAGKAYRLGYLQAGHIGNQDARSYNQRTWCRTWTITPEGRAAVADADVSQVQP